MSFGIGIGDILAVLNLADRLRKEWLDAPDEYNSICASTRDISNVLRDVNDLVERADLTEIQATHLRETISGCTDVLSSLNSIVATYSTVSLSAETKRGRVQRTWKRFRTDPQDIRNVRNRLVAALTSLNTIHSAILRTWTERIQEDTQILVQDKFDRTKFDIVNWLASNTFAEHQTSYLAQRCSDTCDWFTQDKKFLYWRDNDGTTLYCPGIPGAGKSVLVATIVDHLQELYQSDCDVAVIYHYYDTKRPDEQDPRHLLASFVRQLLQQRDVASTPVVELYKKYRSRDTRPAVKELETLFENLVSEYKQVYVIIDALDEANMHQKFQSSLLDEVLKTQNVHRNVNLMVTSRQRLDVASYFDSCEQMEVRARYDDLHKYLDSRMSELMENVSRNVKLQDEIKQRIVRLADGMFLLARLHFDSLCSETTPRAVLKALDRLSKGSEAVSIAYEAARERIAQQNKGRRDLAMQALMWISCGLKEFTLRQLQHALAIEPGMNDIEDEYDLVSEVDLLSICAGLVIVNPESNIVHLVHLTLHEYLDRVRDEWFPKAYAVLASRCIDYLSLGIFGEEDEVQYLGGDVKVSKILRHPDFCGYSFLEHATKYWGFYAKESHDQELTKRLCLSLLAKPVHWRKFYQLLACSHDVDFRAYNRWHEDVTPLHVAAYFGFEDLAKDLVASGHDLRSKDSHEQTPLMWAVTYGQQGMVSFILDRTDTDVLLECDSRGMTPLIFAAQNGHTKIVEFLLEQPNIDPNIISYDGTALNCAASKGHLDVVRMLLSDGKTKPGSRSESAWSPLQSAAFHGHIEVLTLLFDQVHWKPNEMGVGGKSLLHLAAGAGHKQIVEWLIQRPDVGINAPNAEGSTPLAEAARRQQSEIIKLLLAQPGISPNTKDNNGSTPLMEAIMCFLRPKLRDVLAIMSHPGVDLNEVDNHGHGLLVYTLRSSGTSTACRIIFRALMAMPNIEKDIRDHGGYTPLHHASLNLRGYATRLLLEHDEVNPESKAFDGHTPQTLILEKERIRKALKEMIYGPPPVPQSENLDENGEPQSVGFVHRFLPIYSRCELFRDPATPYIVIVASSKEPAFSLPFYKKDFTCSNLRVQDVWMALSTRWQVDTHCIRLKYKGIDLTIGWSTLDDFYWNEGDTINAEISSTARTFDYTAEEYAALDANKWGWSWQALRAASRKAELARIAEHVGTEVENSSSNITETDIDIWPDSGLDTSDEEDEEVQRCLAKHGPYKKKEKPKPSSMASSLEVKSWLFESFEKLWTTGTS